ncbi:MULTISPECIES: metal ABC transporter solute-binding protein, Zn/Mn family [unclassified Campylobacter]|uniref:metal ABC transporter solute-binding protein, Zn/Mn family n=1 Tax=unclassified Campylobacter TaxID=2593542 RepID=UPI0022E99857|nr:MULTISPECIES: zinc ABC transporter substrate-binding protein [unclassified Campylobacter]MDA3043252.1 zinc ABC transporter substrate-binding protein [Campylobacter sp. JMF_09 ED2]MDA3045059.1 zinc ABC transporter substrate-binding protein [Campylobacter sp. JMF_07 ED4]MDA3064341.1 zinc ABC transporter substrate-binding protein [Campylobacter sp. JMF_11 EL3]MDA3071842.1 zinc ABC transporter substrate-binding protein [Campylobacter sp. VBCF_03 NA9]MDA3075224.1 zinc ABC transporter substrate-b
MKILPKFLIIPFLFSANFAQDLAQISVTIEPVRYFAQKIADDDFVIKSVVDKGADPHTYEPKPATMRDIAKSVAYFGIGTEFDEVWLKRFSANASGVKFYDLSEGIEKINFENLGETHEEVGEHDTRAEKHEEQGDHADHAHDGADPHIWLDPILVKQISQNIAKNLCELNGANCAKYEQNLAKFEAELDELHAYALQNLSNLSGAKFIIYHPTLGYFARRYNLTQISVEQGGGEPKPADLADLIKLANDEKVGVIFTSPQFASKAAQILATQTGAKLTQIDFLSYEWQSELKKLIDEISAAGAQK